MKYFTWLTVLLIGIISLTSFETVANDTETDFTTTIETDVGFNLFVVSTAELIFDIKQTTHPYLDYRRFLVEINYVIKNSNHSLPEQYLLVKNFNKHGFHKARDKLRA